MTLTASAISAWECVEYGFAALVAIACFGEYIADFTEWWTRGGAWKWFGDLENRKDSVAKFSTLVLIAALAGELVCVVRTNQLSGLEIATLGDGAERIQKNNLFLQGEVLRLRMAMAGRELTENQQRQIGAALLKFSGSTVFLRSYPGDGEAKRLGLEIGAALALAHVPTEGRIEELPNDRPLIFGIEVECAQTEGKPGEQRDFSIAIIEELSRIGNLSVRPLSEFGCPNLGFTAINIGVRPPTLAK